MPITLTARATMAAAAFACSAVALASASTRPVADTPVPAPQAAAPQHPSVEAAQDCETCHTEQTPLVVQRWEKSAHGMNSVKCFVCHGALDDKEFTTRPAMAKCESCHAEQVDSLKSGAPVMKDKTCFSCHDPHALNPHAAGHGGKT